MDAVTYINTTYTIISDISPKNYAKLARNNIDGKLYVLKFLKAYDVNVYFALQKLNVNGISKIYEVLESPTGLYIVEEYINGVTLEQRFQNLNPNDNPAVLLTKCINQVLYTLKFLHDLSVPIIHRDIKPDNIMLTDNDTVKLIDFNISRGFTGQTEHDTIAMGTSSFAAPEQYGFKESDPRTDIYGVGATAKYIMEKYRISSMLLQGFVEKATSFSPDARFATAEEAIYYLEHNGTSKEEAESWKSFLPPGFRTGKVSHILIACFSYLMMFVHTFNTVRMRNSSTEYRSGQYMLTLVLIWSWFILFSGFSFNYLGVHKIFHIDKLTGSKKIMAILGVDFLILVITLLIGAFFVNKV